MKHRQAAGATRERAIERASDLANWLRGGRAAWLLSLLIHCASFAALGLLGQREPQGAASEPAREAGIVLVARSAERAAYFTDATSDARFAPAATMNDVATLFIPGAAQQPAIAD